MKMLIVITLAAVMFSAPMAARANDACTNISEMAASVMLAHQNGVPMSTSVEIANSTGVEAVSELAMSMIMEAYGSSRWHTEKSKMRAVSDFRDKWHMACLKSSM